MAPLQLDTFAKTLNSVTLRHNRVSNRRILIIYDWRLTRSDIEVIIPGADYSYTYYKGKTYVMYDNEDFHPQVRSLDHYDTIYDNRISPVIKAVRCKSNQRIITQLIYDIESEQHQFDKKATIAIVMIIILIIMSIFLML